MTTAAELRAAQLMIDHHELDWVRDRVLHAARVWHSTRRGDEYAQWVSNISLTGLVYIMIQLEKKIVGQGRDDTGKDHGDD